MGHSIYLADDEKSIRELLHSFLASDGYTVRSFESGDALLEAFRQEPAELVILDIMMPGTDGLTVCRELRAVSDIPIILLTAKDSELDYVMGISQGSDDYLTKPFDIGEFLARVRALTRRSAAKQLSGLTCGNFTLDRASMELSCGTSSVCLSSREAAMLELFIREEGRLLTETQLLEHTWGSTSYDEGASDPLPPTQEAQLVWTYVSYLRKKMQALGANRSIQRTEEGYRLTAADA